MIVAFAAKGLAKLIARELPKTKTLMLAGGSKAVATVGKKPLLAGVIGLGTGMAIAQPTVETAYSVKEKAKSVFNVRTYATRIAAVVGLTIIYSMVRR